MDKLDSNAAWKEATALVAANREVFLALAGVFFLLPSLAMAVIVGEPEMTPGMDRDGMMAAIGAFYAEAWWIIALSTVLQIIGMLAILTLMRDRSRPTVGEAIKAGLTGFLPYLVAQLIFAVGIGVVGGLLIGAAAAVLPALAAALVLVVLAFAVFAAIRLILVAPIIAVEGVRNPITALKRSWTLTRGNFWRIFGFLALIFVLFFVILAVVMLLVGLVLAVVSEGETQRVLAAAVSSTLMAVAVLYLVGITAAIHRQLAGPGAEALGVTFE